jgi:hypothetical protein
VLPALYQLAQSGYGTYFHDITSGSNGGYSAGPGYDLVTGIGTPKASQLVPMLINLVGSGSGVQFGATPATTSTTGTRSAKPGLFPVEVIQGDPNAPQAKALPSDTSTTPESNSSPDSRLVNAVVLRQRGQTPMGLMAENPAIPFSGSARDVMVSGPLLLKLSGDHFALTSLSGSSATDDLEDWMDLAIEEWLLDSPEGDPRPQ